jgi:hypothetical protein
VVLHFYPEPFLKLNTQTNLVKLALTISLLCYLCKRKKVREGSIKGFIVVKIYQAIKIKLKNEKGGKHE